MGAFALLLVVVVVLLAGAACAAEADDPNFDALFSDMAREGVAPGATATAAPVTTEASSTAPAQTSPATALDDPSNFVPLVTAPSANDAACGASCAKVPTLVDAASLASCRAGCPEWEASAAPDRLFCRDYCKASVFEPSACQVDCVKGRRLLGNHLYFAHRFPVHERFRCRDQCKEPLVSDGTCQYFCRETAKCAGDAACRDESFRQHLCNVVCPEIQAVPLQGCFQMCLDTATTVDQFNEAVAATRAKVTEYQRGLRVAALAAVAACETRAQCDVAWQSALRASIQLPLDALRPDMIQLRLTAAKPNDVLRFEQQLNDKAFVAACATNAACRAAPSGPCSCEEARSFLRERVRSLLFNQALAKTSHDDENYHATLPGACYAYSECRECQTNCTLNAQLLMMSRLIGHWGEAQSNSSSPDRPLAERLLNGTQRQELQDMAASPDFFALLRAFFERLLGSCAGNRACAATVNRLGPREIDDQIMYAKGAFLNITYFPHNPANYSAWATGAFARNLLGIYKGMYDQRQLRVQVAIRNATLPDPGFFFAQSSAQPRFYVPGIVVSGLTVVACVVIALVGELKFRALLHDAVQLSVLIGCFLLASFRLIFWVLQPLMKRVYVHDIGNQMLPVEAMGAMADFAERMVPLLFALTLLLFVNQWAKVVLHFFRSSDDTEAHARKEAWTRYVLIGVAAVLTLASLAINIGASIIQGSIPASVGTISLSSVDGWIGASKILLLVLVLVPCVFVGLLVGFAAAVLWKITRDAEKTRFYLRPVLRMLVILSLVLAFVVLRVIVSFMIYFAGVDFALQYYVGYLVAETLPLIPILWLVVIAHYNHFQEAALRDKDRRRSVAADRQSVGTGTAVPLLNEADGGGDDDTDATGSEYNY